jgi:hypothetical protein
MLENNTYKRIEKPIKELVRELVKEEIDIYKNIEKKIEDIEIDEEIEPNVLICLGNREGFMNIYSTIKIIITDNVSLERGRWLEIPENVEYVITRGIRNEIYRNNRDRYDYITIIIEEYEISERNKKIKEFIEEMIYRNDIKRRNIVEMSLLKMILIYYEYDKMDDRMFEIVKILIENNKEEIDERKKIEETVIYKALLNGHYEIAKLILNKMDEEVMYSESDNKLIILDSLFYSMGENKLEMLYEMIKIIDIRRINKILEEYGTTIIIYVYDIINRMTRYYDIIDGKMKYDEKTDEKMIDGIIGNIIERIDDEIMNKTTKYGNSILHSIAESNYKNKGIIEKIYNRTTEETRNRINVVGKTAEYLAIMNNNEIYIEIIKRVKDNK